MASNAYARSKGKSGEQILADMLTEATGIQFRRTPSSGSLRTHISKKSTVGQKTFYASDVQCDAEYARFFKFAIESKNLKDINYYGIMIGKCAEFDDYWEQTCNEVASKDIFPVLCIKTNHRKYLAFTTYKGKTDWYDGVLLYRNKKNITSVTYIYYGLASKLAKEIAIEFNLKRLK